MRRAEASPARLSRRKAGLALLGLSAALGATACGDEVPAGGVARAPIAPPPRRFVPDELVPGHLDLVVRLDLERMRVALGEGPDDALGARLGDEPLVLRALGEARSALLGLRATTLEAGDHVLVLEGHFAKLSVDEAVYAPLPTDDARVRAYARRAPARRPGTELVIAVDDRIVAFASPLEADALLRVATRGPDPARGAPASEGLVSLVYRPRRLDRALEERFPSIARLVAQTERVRAQLDSEGEGLAIGAELVASSEGAAARIGRFFEALREGAGGEGPSAALAALRVDQVGSAVQLRLPVPPSALLELLSASATTP